ncbi:MAG: GvpL/GvpF family gas vesicle protein [Desulfobacteraceae bacterium]|nr:GvpL/GvpF family gas vesicle protein [Desulfobacteraceae bacterium]
MNGRYLYCIVEGSEIATFGKIGIEGNDVYTIPYKDLSAVVHNCPAEPYQSEDEDVVKRWAIAHQKVVDAAWERFGIVLPMGFDTIIRGNAVVDPEENMKAWLKEDYENLKAKMDKVRAKAEYGVQVFWDSNVMAQKITGESVEIKKIDKEIKSKSRGLAYMYRQKLKDLLKKEMENQADRYFKDFFEKIKPYADDLRVEKTRKTEDKNMQMLMNLSCLLPKDGSQGLGDELEKIDALEGFSVRYTGPWPPYSFV